MLNDARVMPAIPAQDLERARAFYAEKLELQPKQERSDGLLYECGGAQFLLFQSTGQASGTHTQLAWEVDDVEKTAAWLRGNGVVFEEYDMPGFKTVEGIVELGDGSKSGFFKDSEGNLLAVGSGMPE
jgi:catechol 2,3-dioxygenase-like lactoylglutathione lyase family enzyme